MLTPPFDEAHRTTMGTQKKLELEAKEKQVVAKSNRLIRARHSFSTYEQRIFAAMVAGIERDNSSFSVQKIPVQEICTKTNASDLYRRIDKITTRLVDQSVVVRTEDEDGKRGFKKVNVLSMCEYKEGEGVIKARFTRDLEPYLLELKNRYTLYLLTVFLRLGSKYSTQIYELLKMREDLGRYRTSVEEFRHDLGLEDKYAQFGDLKRRVIEQARKELKEKADIYFTYSVVRKGRSPVAIEFLIHENEEVIEELDEEILGRKKSISTLPRSEQGGKAKQGERDEDKSDEDGEENSYIPGGWKNVDGKVLFLRELSQEEIESMSSNEVDQLYEEVREAVVREQGKDASKSLIEGLTGKRMLGRIRGD